jgi:hypothetical protein
MSSLATRPNSISTSGNSDYKLNGKSVAYKKYNEQLESFNILVKAKNFLVFQVRSVASNASFSAHTLLLVKGDVEQVASQSPKDLARLIDQISGSLDYKEEYDRCAKELEKATEQSVTRRKGVNGEIKQYKEMKKEAERWRALQEDKVRLSLSRCHPRADRSSTVLRMPLSSTTSSSSSSTFSSPSSPTLRRSRRPTSVSSPSARRTRRLRRSRRPLARRRRRLRRSRARRRRRSKRGRRISNLP